MIKWGISAGTHDGSLAVVSGTDILFAGHSERYSGIKNDRDLNAGIITDALVHGTPDIIYWYENPYTKAMRKLYAGQPNVWFSPRQYLKQYGLEGIPVVYGNHHASHMAAGYYTAPFTDSATVVIDAIGEFNTCSVWNNKKFVTAANYPTSLGLFYSAMTARVGLKPNEDEYILMGMSAYGDPNRFYSDIKKLCDDKTNFHRGVSWWKPSLVEADYFDIAASTQKIYEEYFIELLKYARRVTEKENLVLMGGCALNCLANRHISDYFKQHWIMPNPGDAGSSLGAIAAATKERLNWTSPYLGYNINKPYPTARILSELIKTGIAGVANGKAEFGPRALGNRSLLADPRGKDMQDKVNAIKQRQEFRPFAPVILQEDVHKYFNVPDTFESPYMQCIVTCRSPELYPAIVHKDGTSRVQTVAKDQHRGLYKLLKQWKKHSGCPMLLNTSLNIKGMPMVNNEIDAKSFSKYYGIKVLC